MKIGRITAFGAALIMTVFSVPMTAFAEKSESKVRVIVENNTFSKTDGAKWDGILVDKWVTIDSSSTMESIIVEALGDNTYSFPDYGYGPYVSDVAGVGEDTYAVADGYYPGWNIALNDWFTSSGMSSYTVSNGGIVNGDVIDVTYAITGADVGNNWGSNDTTLKSVKFSSGKLNKTFSGDINEYTLALGEGSTVAVTPTANNKVFQVKTFKNSYTPENSASAYKAGQEFSVADGDVIFVGVGNKNWSSSYWGDDPATESVYKFTVQSENPQDIKDAEEVEALIDAIGEVTLDSEEAVTKARTAYLRISDSIKGFVNNLSVLEEAEKKLAELKKQNAPSKEFENMFNDTAAEIAKSDPAVGSEWRMIGLARAGKLSDASKASFLKAHGNYVAEAEGNKLNARRSTENSKESLAAAALGKDPEKYAGKDILTPVKDDSFTSVQGITGSIWANIALTSVGKDSTYTKTLLDAQLESGAFSYDGKSEDVDITAMTVTALAKDKSAASAIEKAVEWLSSKQLADGSYGNCESTAQVIIALSSVGIDCTKDARFIKNGMSLMDGLSAFYLGSGAFAHEGNTANAMATEQAFLALVSYYRLSNSMTALYDLSDVSLSAYVAETTNSGSGSATGAAPLSFVMITLSAAALCLSRRSNRNDEN